MNMTGPPATCNLTTDAGTTPIIKLTTVLTGTQFTRPVQLLAAPDGSKRSFIVTQTGHIYVTAANPDPSGTASEWLNIEQSVDSTGAQSGLLGMAFDPGFAQNGRVYLSSTRQMGGGLQLVLSRLTLSSPMATPDPSSEVVLLTIALAADAHVAGPIAFGPDGYLYLATGDGGQDGDPQSNAQNLGSLLGKILRLDVSQGGASYAIPMANPFVGQPGAKTEIYALGFRNPWRFSIDAMSGVAWAGDQGQSTTEELDNILAGGNYGWNIEQGTDCYTPMTKCNSAGLIPPSQSYQRTDGAEVIGGLVYRGQNVASIYGGYVFGDEVSGTLWMLPTRDDQTAGYMRVALGHSDRKVVGFGADADGELYVLDNKDGLICRIDPADGSNQTPVWPLALSKTTYFSNLTTRKLASGVLSYDVNVPLWSDGAAKERGLYLPTGTTMTYNDNETAWTLPMGAVLIKTFLLGGKPIETRLLRNQSDGFHGASYRWNAAATDANLMTTDAQVQIGSQVWGYPSRADCLKCHTQAAGQVLGLNTAEMNLSHDMQGTGNVANQITTLKQLGLFSNPPAQDPSLLARFPAPTDTTASLGTRARAYLNANCAHCHQPGGLADMTFDIRYPIPLINSNVCNLPPQKGDAGVPGSVLLAIPGNPNTSVMYLRMNSLDPTLRMPSLASHIVDPTGTPLIQQWIQSLTTCQ